MKREQDYLETSIWYRERITNPYEVIAEFFFDADIATHRKMVRDILLAANSDKVYDKDSPSDLLLQFKFVESVINAAYLINEEGKESPIKIEKKDVFNPNLYCSWHKDLTEWDFFPRQLSLKEYINPYLVFARFFKHKALLEWKQELQEILDYALARSSISESTMNIDTLAAYFFLSKLIEAAHLIDVRETSHIGGYIKNRFSEGPR
jgi:hypothetical protein